MEGYLLRISPNDHFKKWKKRYFKLDDISARLLSFTDASQSELKRTLMVENADVYTPVLGDRNHGVNLDDKNFSFVVREASGHSDEIIYLNAEDNVSKQKWIKALHKVSKNGAKEAKFSKDHSENDYSFEARVSEYRIHDKGYVEYKIRCCCRIMSKTAAKRLKREWDVWHRFSDFSTLDSYLRKDLSFQMDDIKFLPKKREAFRNILGTKLDAEFLEQRRSGLDTYIQKICSLRTAVDFFKHHSNIHLKSFFDFEVQCKQNDDLRHSLGYHVSEHRHRGESHVSKHSRKSTSHSKSSNRDRTSSNISTESSESNRSDRGRHHRDRHSKKEKDRKSKKEKKSRQTRDREYGEHDDSGRKSDRKSKESRRKNRNRDDHARSNRDHGSHEATNYSTIDPPRENAQTPPPPPPYPYPESTGKAKADVVENSSTKDTLEKRMGVPSHMGRSNLLSQIHGGIALRKTTCDDRSSPNTSSSMATGASNGGNNMMNALQMAMKSRQMQKPDQGQDADDDEDWN